MKKSKKFSVFKLVKGLSEKVVIILMELDDEEYYLVGTDDSDDITLELKSSLGTFKKKILLSRLMLNRRK